MGCNKLLEQTTYMSVFLTKAICMKTLQIWLKKEKKKKVFFEEKRAIKSVSVNLISLHLLLPSLQLLHLLSNALPGQC